MFGDPDDLDSLPVDPPDVDPSHDFHNTHHYCLSCGASRFSMLARHTCKPKRTSAPVTVQPVAPKPIDPDFWFNLNREMSA